MPSLRFTAIVAVLLVATLSGCTDKSDDKQPIIEGCTFDRALCDLEGYLADHYCVANDIRPRVYAPDTPSPELQADPWVLGDAWTYRLAVDGEALPDTQLVYYDDQDFSQGEAQHYMVGTPTREEALQHALFSVNPMIGRIHRTLYSPHESGDHADMFHFPLCSESTWTTTFFGMTWEMEATQQSVPIPGGEDPNGFRIDGKNRAGTLLIEYSPQIKWFSKLVFEGRDQDVKMVLTETTRLRDGEYHFLRGQKDEVIALGFQTGDVTVPRADGSDGAYDTLGYALEVERTRGDGRVEVHVRDPNGLSVACVGIAGQGALGQTDCPRGPLIGEAPWQAGDWRVTIDTPPLDPTEVDGEVRIVSIYDRGGTL